MDIVIHSYLSGSFLLEKEPNAWDAIVVLDSTMVHSEFVANHTDRHIYLRFDDVVVPNQRERMATLYDVEYALDFASNSKNLAVCCRAGQSRSAA